MKTRSLITIVAMLLFAAGKSNATVIDFDSLADGTIVGATYPGVTFVDATVDSVCGGCAGASPPNNIRHSTAGYNPVPSDPIEAIFAGIASSVSVTGIDIGADGFQLLAYNAVGTLIDSMSVAGTGAGVGEFFTLTVTGAIKRVEFSQVSDALGGADGSVYDDFTFITGVVPEPATLVLMGMGLAGLGFSRRKVS